MKPLWLLAALIPCSVWAADTVVIDGTATTQPTQWTVEQLKHAPGVPTTQVSYESHGEMHHSTCVALLDLLKASGVSAEIKADPKADPKTKHAALRVIVMAVANDGYGVVFSLAELLPEIGHRAVWVALDEDEKPLGDREEPVKLIVPEDAKPARWVHGVTEFAVDAAGAAH